MIFNVIVVVNLYCINRKIFPLVSSNQHLKEFALYKSTNIIIANSSKKKHITKIDGNLFHGVFKLIMEDI